MRIQGSAAAFEVAQSVLGGGVSSGVRRTISPHPVFFESGQGPRLRDVDGNLYLDHVLGWGQAILGHAHPAQAAAVTEQLTRGTAHGGGSNLEVAVAERVLARVPGIQRLLWSNTGSEADLLALRLARAATGRNRFVKFAGHYHGWSDAMLLGYLNDPAGETAGLESRGQSPRLREDVEILPFGDLDPLRRVLQDGRRDIAAVFVDPLMCNTGLIQPPVGFLEGLRSLCADTGTLLVFDEVITGFRVAKGGAIERFGVVPDLVVFAKAISGGFPLSAVAGRADILDLVTDGVFYSGTYNGNLVSLAAAAACLDTLAQPGVYEAFESRGQPLAVGLTAALRSHQTAGTVRQVGPLLHCSIDSPGVYRQIAERLLRHGVYAAPDDRWYISTAHSETDIAETVTAFGQSLRDLDDADSGATVGQASR